MKRTEVTEVSISDHNFYLTPFPAFKATNIAGELAVLLVPIVSALIPLAGGEDDEGKAKLNINDFTMEQAVPALSKAFSTVSGDKFEALIKRLLIENNNVAVEGEATNGKTERLTKDLADEIFCQDVFGMLALCWEVIKLNFAGFFAKLGTQSGSLGEALKTVMEK